MRIICEACKIPLNLTFPKNGRGKILDSETFESIDTYNIIGILSSDKINGKPYREIGRIRCPFCKNLFDVEFSMTKRKDDECMRTARLVKDEPKRKDPIETRLDSIDRSLAELVKVIKDWEEYFRHTYYKESTKELQDDAKNAIIKMMNEIDEMKHDISVLEKRLDNFHNV